MAWYWLLLISLYVVAGIIMADYLIRDSWALRGELKGKFKRSWMNKDWFGSFYVLWASITCGIIWPYILASTFAHNWLDKVLRPPLPDAPEPETLDLEDPEVLERLSQKIWDMR